MMKKVFLMGLLCLLSSTAFSQEKYKVDGEDIIVSSIIEDTGLSQEEAYAAINYELGSLWLSDKESVVRDDKDCIIKSASMQIISFDFLDLWQVHSKLTIRTDIKDNRVRIIVSASQANVVARGSGDIRDKSDVALTYTFVSAPPFTNKSPKPSLVSKKVAVRAFDELVLKMNEIKNKLETALKKESKEEEW